MLTSSIYEITAVVEDHDNNDQDLCNNNSIINPLNNDEILFDYAHSLEDSDPQQMVNLMMDLANNRNYPNAFSILSDCFRMGIGVQVDEKKAFEYAVMGSELGDLNSIFYVGNFYKFGVYQQEDIELAREWYERAGNAGHGMSCFVVGDIYHVTKVDYSNAMKWYLKGLELKVELCASRLGFMYEKGQGCEIDQGKAFQLYLRAANSGIAPSMYNMGICYEQGIGCEYNYKKSMEWFVKAARHGHKEANAKVTLRCMMGGFTFKDFDFKLAYELYLLDAPIKKSFVEYCTSVDVPISKFYIAQEYYYENPRNNSHCSEIIEMLESTQQFYQSQNLLGIIYLEGKIIKQNLEMAFELIEKAAESKNEKCLFDLAIVYLYGYGCKKDSLESRHRLKQLALQEYQPAIDLLEGSFQDDLLENREYSDVMIISMTSD